MTNMLNNIRRAGGLRRFLSMWLRANFRSFWYALQSIPYFKDVLNRFYISSSLAAFEDTVPRIPRYTLAHDYASMDVLYDESRTTYSRLLPRAPEHTASLPPIRQAASLFTRDSFTPETNRNLNVLISYYAQWFTHQFLNTNPDRPIEANQPLGINMSMLYGSTKATERSVRSFKGGLLKAHIQNGNEFPEVLDIPEGSRMPGSKMFRMPIARANMVPGFAAVHIVFFRRHQHIARELAKWADDQNLKMDDEELFQKSKLLMGLTVLKITMHDYVAQSLQSSHVKINMDQTVKKSKMWKWFGPSYFPPCNAIQIEFNFLYRWHQLTPDAIKIVKNLPENAADPSTILDVNAYDCDEISFPDDVNEFLGDEWNSVDQILSTDDGLERVLFSAATQRAGKLELFNTNKWLQNHVVIPGMRKAREYELASYNDYREHFGFGRVTSFEQITGNIELQQKLKSVYGDVDRIEYYAGIFAEDKDFGGVHGPFLATIGVAMTFSAIHASRLFESDIINETSLTPRGMELVEEVNFIRDITKMHTKLGSTPINFTMPKQTPAPSPMIRHVTGYGAVNASSHTKTN